MKTIHGLSDSRMMLGMSLLLGTVFLSGPGYAEVYKWKDAEGNIQYTQQPPPGDTKREVLNPSTGTSSSQSLSPPPVTEPEKAKSKPETGKGNAQTAEMNAEEKAELKRKCDNVRARLQSLQRPRVATTDEDGNRVILGEDERQAQIKETTRLLKEHCK
jgi:hypothetical protein